MTTTWLLPLLPPAVPQANLHPWLSGRPREECRETPRAEHDTVHSFGNDEGSARLEPIDSRMYGEPCGFESFGMEVKSSEICAMVFKMSLRKLACTRR
jgi:hypothetical protein